MIALAEEDKTTGSRRADPASAAPPAAHIAAASPPASPIQTLSTAPTGPHPGSPPAALHTMSPQAAAERDARAHAAAAAAAAAAAPPAYSDTRYTPVSPQTGTLARAVSASTSASAPSTRPGPKEEARSEEGGAMRAVSKGLFAIVAAPAVVAGAGIAGVLAVLYGAGKLVEGIGKGLAAGPEAAYRKYQAREERSVERRRKGKKARGRP